MFERSILLFRLLFRPVAARFASCRVRRWPAAAALAVCCAVTVAGCGFQLRSWRVADAFQTARVEADASVDFAADVRRALREAGVTVVNGNADLVLRLTDQAENQRAASVAADARVAEREMILRVAVAYFSRDGAPLAPARVLRAERIARLDRNGLLGSGAERALLATEMRAELVGRMLRALDGVEPAAAVGEPAAP